MLFTYSKGGKSKNYEYKIEEITEKHVSVDVGLLLSYWIKNILKESFHRLKMFVKSKIFIDIILEKHIQL